MSDFHANISVCHACPHRERPKGGRCACTVDGVDIMDHAKAILCPRGFYGPGMVGRLVAGAVGLIKAGAGINRAPEDVQRQRAEICRGCENVEKDDAGEIAKCRLCGCGLLGKKLAIAGEKCPVEKWVQSGVAQITASKPT